MDNFASFFGFEKADLLGARSEAEQMSETDVELILKLKREAGATP